MKNSHLTLIDPIHVGPEPDFEWLLMARHDIQHDLLGLFEFVRDSRRELLKGEEANRAACALLVGAGLSLWRASFLSDIARGWPEILDQAQLLLYDVLLTNTLAFSGERSVKDWMFGFYLNNAIYRLAEVKYRLAAPVSPALEEFDRVREHALVGKLFDSTESWGITQSVLREMTTLLKQRVSTEVSTPETSKSRLQTHSGCG